MNLILEFDVYLKTKINGFARVIDELPKDSDQQSRGVETKSVDDSKMSVYFTPTDGNLSPEQNAGTPIHSEQRTPESIRSNKMRDQQGKLMSAKLSKNLKIHREPQRLNGGSFDETAEIELDITDRNAKVNGENDVGYRNNSNEDNTRVGDENDDDNDYVQANRKSFSQVNRNDKFTSSLSASHENELLLYPTSSKISSSELKPIVKSNSSPVKIGQSNNKKLLFSNKPEYSYEPIRLNEKIERMEHEKKKKKKHDKHHRNHERKIMNVDEVINLDDDRGLLDVMKMHGDNLNIIMDESGNTIVINLCDNLMQTGPNLDEIVGPPIIPFNKCMNINETGRRIRRHSRNKSIDLNQPSTSSAAVAQNLMGQREPMSHSEIKDKIARGSGKHVILAISDYVSEDEPRNNSEATKDNKNVNDTCV